MKKPYKIDIAVLLIFWARPEPFRKVFEQIKKARPSKLFLYQDGPRENRPDDIVKIKKCREIAEDIDWECEVHRFYQRENLGCVPSGFIAEKWIFETEEMGIVLEDDDVPSQSFFPFCKELLEKYKDDERIDRICGMNNTGISEHIPYSYFFSTTSSTCGWASWKRVVDTWDETYGFLDDAVALKQIAEIFREKGRNFDSFIKACIKRRQSGRGDPECIPGASTILNSRLNIVATQNMICNIGVTENATHSPEDIRMMPRGIRRIFNMKTYEVEFPLKHPKYVVEDVEFRKRLYRIMGWGHPFVSSYRKCESVLLRIRYGDFKGLWQGLLKKLDW